MKVKDKGVLWNFLRKKASEKLQQEQNSLVHLDAEINSVEINLEKMGEMRAIYRDQLNSGSKRMLPANRIRLASLGSLEFFSVPFVERNTISLFIFGH